MSDFNSRLPRATRQGAHTGQSQVLPLCPGKLVEKTTSTNPRYLFLREIGGPSCLKPFLDRVRYFGAKSPHWGGTLVIDQEVSLDVGITIPRDFTLAGVGFRGGGVLNFSPSIVGPAIAVDPGGNNVIRDLSIGLTAFSTPLPWYVDTLNGLIGILIREDGVTYIDSVYIYGVSCAIRGENASYVFLTNSLLDGNVTGIEIVGDCHHWRVRECNIRQSARYGVRIQPAGGMRPSDVQISASTIEGNSTRDGALPVNGGAIELKDGFGVFLWGNRFEGNGPTYYPKTAVLIKDTTNKHGAAARAMFNMFSGDQFRLGELNQKPPFHPTDAVRYNPPLTQTHIGFNSSIDFGFTIPNAYPLNRVNEPTKG